MKKGILFLLFLLSAFTQGAEAKVFEVFSSTSPVEILCCYHDKNDTIFVSDTETTYLLFPEKVELVDIGKAGEYAARIEGESVFLKALKSQASQTSLLVRYGKQYYHAKLIFTNQPEKNLYEIRSAAKSTLEAEEGKQEEEVKFGSIRDRLEKVKSLEGRKGMKYSRHSLTVRTTHLQNDSMATYLGFTLKNNSSIDYKIDFIGFSLSEKKGRRFSRNNLFKKELLPFTSDAPAVVHGGEEEKLFYALPLYAMASRGKLQIQIREKNGSRVLRLSIPARLINNAKPFVYE